MSTFENFRVDPLTGKLTMTTPVTGGTELPTAPKVPSTTALASPTNTTTTIVVADARSITSADVDQDGHLIVTYSDLTTDDLGIVTGTGGTNGNNGKTVLSGAGAPDGALGTNGDFYIDTTADAIYGPKGTPSPGWNTATSLVGADGIDGTDGIDGIDGIDGTDGSTVLNGTGAPSGGTGADGDFYIDTTADAIYGPKTAGAWGSATPLVGAAGADGIVPAYNTLATVKAIDHTTLVDGDVIAMLGSATLGDGLGGLFFWNAASAATPDDILVITPTSNSGNGRFLAVRNHFVPEAGTIGAAATDLATTTALVNELRTILIDNGFGL